MYQSHTWNKKVRITSYISCPACEERCCDCLVDYLPAMREGNHQHRDGCRHYVPLDHIATLPATLYQLYMAMTGINFK
ncbi:hypothetical protein B0J17DRAFT_703785 [Rhizoctonia solani]|nr:hypothetical protein B0J17DRAFT_703785 [Rhizoctonia solani]